MTLPLITGECGNCVFSQRELCGNCAGTVRELCGNCARAWNAVLSVQAGPSEACSLPFPAMPPDPEGKDPRTFAVVFL